MERLSAGSECVYPGTLGQRIQKMFLDPQQRLWVLATIEQNPQGGCQSSLDEKVAIGKSFWLAWIFVRFGFAAIVARAKTSLGAR